MTYFAQRMAELGLVEADYTHPGRNVLPGGDESGCSFQYFAEGKNGGIDINYPDLDTWGPLYYPAGPTQKPRFKKRTRLHPDEMNRMQRENPSKEAPKYISPKGCLPEVFWPLRLLQAFRDKLEVPELILVEGEFKAFAGARCGLDVSGIPGIWAFGETERDADTNNVTARKLHPDLLRFVRRCKVQRLTLLLDSDVFDLSLKPGKGDSDRPQHFLSCVRSFKETCVAANVQSSFVYIRPDALPSVGKLGLDDLLSNCGYLGFSSEGDMPSPEALLGMEALPVNFGQAQRLPPPWGNTAEGTPTGTAHKAWHETTLGLETSPFVHTDLTTCNNQHLQHLFCLDSPQRFYDRYKDHPRLRTKETFTYNGKPYAVGDDGGVAEHYPKNDLLLQTTGGYWYDGPKGRREISNFVMHNRFLLQSREGAKRIIEIVNDQRQSAALVLSSEDMVSLSRFRAIVESKGKFLFHGTDADLMLVKGQVFNEVVNASEITTMGWQPEGKFFAWANGLTDHAEDKLTGRAMLHETDDFGIVKHNEKHYYFPAYSKINQDRTEEFLNERRMTWRHSKVGFTEWAVLMEAAFGEKATLAIPYAVAACFRDIVFDKCNFFPLLGAFGRPRTGKSSFCRALVTLMGSPEPAIHLGGASTVKGFMRKFAQVRNGMVWLDEYKNSIPQRNIDALKGIYDGTGYERAQMTNDNRTQTTPILSAALVSGEELPTIAEALLSRFILFDFDQDTWESPDDFDRLTALESDGLACITSDIMLHRNLVADRFQEINNTLYKVLATACNTKGAEVNSRLLTMYAAICTPLTILIQEKKLAYPKIEWEEGVTLEPEMYFTATAIKYIKRMVALSQDTSEIDAFWDLVQEFINERMLLENRHWKIVGGNIFLLQVKMAYGQYAETFRRRFNKAPLDRQTLETRLKNHPAFKEAKSCVRFKDGPSNSAFAFDLAKLKIDPLYAEKGLMGVELYTTAQQAV